MAANSWLISLGNFYFFIFSSTYKIEGLIVKNDTPYVPALLLAHSIQWSDSDIGLYFFFLIDKKQRGSKYNIKKKEIILKSNVCLNAWYVLYFFLRIYDSLNEQIILDNCRTQLLQSKFIYRASCSGLNKLPTKLRASSAQ